MLPAYAFTERRRLAGIRRLWGADDHGEADHEGELVQVVYHRHRGVFRPHSITTTYGECDATYSQTTGELYIHNSGSGSEYASVSRYTDPANALKVTRTWIREGAKIVAYKGRRLVKVKRDDLASFGYLLIDGPEPRPFAGAMDGDTVWCAACKDYLPDTGDYREIYIYACCKCQERSHMHGVGQLFVVTTDGAGVDPGLYKIKRLPYYADGMVEMHLYEDALERLGGVPDGLSIEGGYACGHICDACRPGILLAAAGLARAA